VWQTTTAAEKRRATFGWPVIESSATIQLLLSLPSHHPGLATSLSSNLAEESLRTRRTWLRRPLHIDFFSGRSIDAALAYWYERCQVLVRHPLTGTVTSLSVLPLPSARAKNDFQDVVRRACVRAFSSRNLSKRPKAPRRPSTLSSLDKLRSVCQWGIGKQFPTFHSSGFVYSAPSHLVPCHTESVWKGLSKVYTLESFMRFFVNNCKQKWSLQKSLSKARNFREKKHVHVTRQRWLSKKTFKATFKRKISRVIWEVAVRVRVAEWKVEGVKRKEKG